MRAHLAAMIARAFPLWSRRSARTRTRMRRLFYVVVFYVVGSAPAWAEDGKPTSPEGVGGLFTVPEWGNAGGKTLFEAYSMGRYQIYIDVGWGDFPEKAAGIIYSALTALALGLTKLAVGLTWWSVELTGGESGTDTIGTAIETAAGKFNALLLPSAIMLGGLVAYLRVRRAEDALSQLSTVALAVLFAIGLASSGSAMTAKLNDARTAVANTVNSIGGESLKASNQPFAYNEGGSIGGSAPQRAQRLEGDAVWRTFAVSPWCQTQFGSPAACKRYGAAWLAAKDTKARKDVLEKQIKRAEGGESETYKYIQGQKPADRIGTSIFHIVIGIIGVIVLGGLALMALIPWVLALLLLFLASVFSLLLCIPGKPRQIGQDYFTSILGLVATSALTGGITAGMLLVIQAADQLTGGIGWLPSFLFTIAALVSAWAARTRLERLLTGGGGSGFLGAMAGMAVGRTIMRGASRAFGVGGRGMGRLGKAGAAKAGGAAWKSAQKAGAAAGGAASSLASSGPVQRASTGARSFYQAKSRSAAQAARAAAAPARGMAQRGAARVRDFNASHNAPKVTPAQAALNEQIARSRPGTEATAQRMAQRVASPGGQQPARAGQSAAPTWERRQRSGAAAALTPPGATPRNTLPRRQAEANAKEQLIREKSRRYGDGSAPYTLAGAQGPRAAEAEGKAQLIRHKSGTDRAGARARAATPSPDRTYHSETRRNAERYQRSSAAPAPATAPRSSRGTSGSTPAPARPSRGASTGGVAKTGAKRTPRETTSGNPFVNRSSKPSGQQRGAPKARGRFNRKGKK